MLTVGLVDLGLALLRVIRIDLRGAMTGIHRGGEFDTAVRFLDNAWRNIAGAVSWVAFWVILWIPWQIVSALFRSSNPNLSRAVADLGGGLVAFVLTGFCLYILRMAASLTLGQRESRRAMGRVDDAAQGRGALSSASPVGVNRLVVALTTPTDFDFVVEFAVAAVILVALINYAHSQGHPL